MKNSTVQKILLFDYVLAAIVTGAVFYLGVTSSLANNLYGVLFLGFIPVFGGINGILIARKWGGFKSAVGRAIIFLSLGLIAWGIGTYIYSGIYNVILQVEVPYPSYADIGYVLALPLWALGMIHLSRATGAKYGLQSSGGKFALLIIPASVIAASYYLLVIVARGGSLTGDDTALLKVILDLTYPLGDVIILTLATLIYGLSYSYFGGVFKKAIYMILSGFVLMYFADFAFSYTTTLGTWYPGDWNDLLFATAMLALSSGVALMDPAFLHKDSTA
ncbi:hypothetical protein A2763_01625 [Candidatus Kaiserbacteria bacterium RIFCSPHIGHO2_01_FULL_54_36]|uniref:Uncharacterized protein n=1 Tax=Candidatus Kaiserbacteria bacterium RIFCSPHIGHO2_01_FULL_54_36 TaxID=1798482 RepID=A0A1F6CLK8_9BACT|nr:MAG: hypothetical protein A2763_01625 [Candidatus Kaiserbacteria bacterium RIFCSPHIGHO2_01_FULL_54_36]OGG75475.1 MAG: hypothetical protein A3A41_01225 [Candidatus Kaiserbacteria bacterium RIFCSPLOWO2_01_FULL_54_22]